MRILIYDPDQHIVDTIKEELNAYKDKNVPHDIVGISNILELSTNIKFHQYDIAYLDDHIDNYEDINVVHEIIKMNMNCLILFMTSEYQYVYDLFDHRIFHYLHKPIEDHQFQTVYYKTLEIYKKIQSLFFFNTSEGKKPFHPYDILYIETYYHNLKIITTNGSYYSNIKNAKMMKETLKQFDFIQVHQSYFVNMNYIHKVQDDYILLDNGTEFPISVNKKNMIIQELHLFKVRQLHKIKNRV